MRSSRAPAARRRRSATACKNIFDVSLPVIDNLVPYAKWIASLPASERPKTAAYATSDDPFTQPQIPLAQKIMQAAGIKTVYNKVFPAEVTDYTPIATAVASSKAEAVVLGSVDVPTVSAFVHAFIQQHYNPKSFIATAGPDQGAAVREGSRWQRQRRGDHVPERLVSRLRQCAEPEYGQ